MKYPRVSLIASLGWTPVELDAELSLGAEQPDSFVVTGVYHVFNNEGFPATMHIDGANEQSWIDVQASEDYSSWVLLDWSTPEPRGYIGNDHQCYALSLSRGVLPSAEQLEAAFVEGQRRRYNRRV